MGAKSEHKIWLDKVRLNAYKEQKVKQGKIYRNNRALKYTNYNNKKTELNRVRN